jgi:hypothetical protein
MTSKIKLINNALLLLGDNAIQSLSDPGFSTTVADSLYLDTYKEVLSSHPWSFAFKEQELSQFSEPPPRETGYNYAYRMPVDAIRIWQLYCHQNYTIVGDKIYTNANKVLCRYIFKVAESQLPPHVAKTIEYKLAAEFAIPITDNGNYSQLYEQKHIIQLAKAQAIDSQNRPQVAIVDSPFTDVRNGAGYNFYSGWQ